MEDGMGGDEKCMKRSAENLMGRHHVGDPSVDGRIT
jgi:hypothetical protein